MKQVLQVALQGYKRVISPMLPHACRFTPTCSEYALEAVERHGAVRGSAMVVWRLMRCHPFARAGYDPVPAVRHRQQNLHDGILTVEQTASPDLNAPVNRMVEWAPRAVNRT